MPSSDDLIASIENKPPGAIEPITTDASAAEGVELRGIERDDALAVLEGVFAGQLQAPGDILDEASTADLLVANVAVVGEEDASETVPADESSAGELDELPPPAGAEKAQLRGETGDELVDPSENTFRQSEEELPAGWRSHR